MLSNSYSAGLAALLPPETLSELMASYAAGLPYVVHGLGAAASELTDLSFLSSVEALLNSWPHPVSAHLPDAADESSAVYASTVDARKLFDNGMSLLFNDAHTISPQLRKWLAAIRHDLCLSELTQSRCLMYATPKGKGTAPHFDQNVNLVLQLHGEKRWQLAPNTSVMNPMSRHTMGGLVDPELQTYASLPMPEQMPRDCQTVDLSPGSLLLVPRGTWHCTQGISDALALNFTYTAPTWLDIFTTALRSKLAMSSQWRQTAAPAAPEDFQRLLHELADEAPQWLALDILAVTESTGEEGDALIG
jgi:50S ribosomal protein L16 3-hydroxylase